MRSAGETQKIYLYFNFIIAHPSSDGRVRRFLYVSGTREWKKEKERSAMDKRDQAERYIIPENFIDESRIINGLFRTRFFVEGSVLALASAVPVLLIPVSARVKIMLLISVSCPLFIIGCTGINGDTLIQFVRSFISWKKKTDVMLYDSNCHALSDAPGEEIMSGIDPKDLLIDVINDVRENVLYRNSDEELVEGVNFEFREDADIKALRLDSESYAEDLKLKMEKEKGKDEKTEEEKEGGRHGSGEKMKGRMKGGSGVMHAADSADNDEPAAECCEENDEFSSSGISEEAVSLSSADSLDPLILISKR